MISLQSIYNYIWQEQKLGGNLYTNLRHRNRKYRKAYRKLDKTGKVEGKISIDHREDSST
jgi:IS30 family transposase